MRLIRYALKAIWDVFLILLLSILCTAAILAFYEEEDDPLDCIADEHCPLFNQLEKPFNAKVIRT